MIDIVNAAHPLSEIIRMTVAITTLGSLVCLCWRYSAFVQWNLKFDKDKKTTLYYRYKEITSSEIDRYQPVIEHPYKNWNFVIEFLMLAATPIPYVNFVFEHKGKADYRVYY